jgi:hypothetical protein
MHPLEKFLSLLAQHRIEALADIRRSPGSRKFPQFNLTRARNRKHDAKADEQHGMSLLGACRTKTMKPVVSVALE